MSTKFHGAACKTCRRRGRKCTKELPKCNSCLSKGIECEGYVLKWTGLASRGKFAGKTSMAKSPKQPASTFPDTPNCQLPQDGEIEVQNLDKDWGVLENHHELYGAQENAITFSPSQFDQVACDFQSLIDIEVISQDPNGSESDDNVTSSVETSSMVMSTVLDSYNIPRELKFILNYHLLEVAPRLCVDNTTMRNPYSQYILPLAVQKPALLYACAALAACHFSVRLADQSFHVDCLRFRGKSMRRLQELLWSEQSAKDESNLATVMMLTLTDMCLGGFSNFDAHFTAARRLIDLRGAERTQDAFVEQYIAWLDIMSAASNQRKPRFSSTDISLLRGASDEWSYDVFPCPPDQFEVISDVVDLYKSLQDPSNPSIEMLTRVHDMKAKLLTLPMHNERGASWLHVTEAYRHAIALYMIRLFCLDVDEDETCWLAQSVFYHSKMTPASTGWADHLLWPLFHAGLEFQDQRRQQWLRERSEVMQRSGGFRNVKTAMEILERVWASEEIPDYISLVSSEGLSSMVPV